MKLKHVLIAAAAAVALPAFAGDLSATGGLTRAQVRAQVLGQKSFGEAGPQFFMDPPSMLTRAQVSAQARGLISFGQEGVPFDFNTMSMLTREEVRAQLMAYGPIENAGA